jgi:hypothetical protein
MLFTCWATAPDMMDFNIPGFIRLISLGTHSIPLALEITL